MLWFIDNNHKLGKAAGQVLDDPNAHFLLPAIALAEALFILEKGRTPFTITADELLQAIEADARITISPLTESIIRKTLACKVINEMHDRQIVATALLAQANDVQVAVLTKDENIQNSGLVQTIW